MTEKFRIYYKCKNFIAFKPRAVPDTDKDRFNPSIIWPFAKDNPLVDRNIDDLRKKPDDLFLRGKIRIMMKELEIPGVTVGSDLEIIGAADERSNR
jgi:hypothetical protein